MTLSGGVRLTALMVLALAGVTPPALAQATGGRDGAVPRRIVSFNLCADQLVMALADPEQIAGLSPYAADPRLSVVTAAAARFPRLDWNAESVVGLAPDLVLIGPSARPTRAMLAAMQIRTVDVALVSTLEHARAQAREIGALVGHPERGEAMARALEEAERRLAALARRDVATGLVIERRGYTAGPDSLAAAMIAAAGLKPPAGAPSGYGGFLSLEHLLVIRPDVLVLKDAPETAVDQSALYLTHPALRQRFPAQRIVALPARYTLCGGPALLEGLQYLERALAPLR
ncbi:MAG: ABC transporter substrate-binding protein [Xanthobacteraceae bacterium]|nr:MAG: ABC transporter substrate-binding protein [Xanthobacteraceae bacterium]